jgi:hypothetical protein
MSLDANNDPPVDLQEGDDENIIGVNDPSNYPRQAERDEAASVEPNLDGVGMHPPDIRYGRHAMQEWQPGGLFPVPTCRNTVCPGLEGISGEDDVETDSPGTTNLLHRE